MLDKWKGREKRNQLKEIKDFVEIKYGSWLFYLAAYFVEFCNIIWNLSVATSGKSTAFTFNTKNDAWVPAQSRDLISKI